ILHSLEVDGMIAVSSDLDSCKKVWQLSKEHSVVYPTFGWHPEQPIPNLEEIEQIESLIHRHHEEIVGIGEVDILYYKKAQKQKLELQPYLEIVERFIKIAKQYELPIVLHAVYDDADIVCDLLEKYQLDKAHFHWFKGSQATIKRMIAQKYMISITPDCLYEEEIQVLINAYPLELMMVETDGPWPFEGIYQGKMTHPNMIDDVIKQIARIKDLPMKQVKEKVFKNTTQFYKISIKDNTDKSSQV